MTNRELQNKLAGWPADYEVKLYIGNCQANQGDDIEASLVDLSVYPHQKKILLQDVMEEE